MGADDMMIRGPQYGARGSFTPRTASQTGAQRVQLTQGRYFDTAHNRYTFWAANQAAVAYSVGLTTTYTGLVLSNPSGSSVDLAVIAVGFALSVAPAAPATIGLIGGVSNNGITTHTTPAVARTTFLKADVATGQGKVDEAATLVGTPYWLQHLMGGFTAAALPATAPALIDLGGLFILPPGAYLAIGALTAVTGLGSITWEEIPNDTI